MSKQSYLIALLFFLGTGGMRAQEYLAHPETGVVPCITSEIDALRRAEDPTLGTVEDFEMWMQEHIARTAQQTAGRAVLTIPVVFHIIHEGEAVGTGSNISQARVNDQIEVLIQDFRKMPGTPGFNTNPAGADSEIEFCPAYLAPDGTALAQPGIHRVNVNTLGVTPQGGYDNNLIEGTIKPQTSWDPTQYMNIWVLPGLNGNVAGYAYIPSVPGIPSGGGIAANRDGIVVGSAFVGNNDGRTLTHEMGHWLALYHTWGPGNQGVSNGCAQDDFCGDTPNTADATFGCPSNLVTCTDPIMQANYMDYTSCTNVFTEDQKTRMRAALTGAARRADLLNSTVCDLPSAVPGADFSWSDTVTCDGTVQFFDQSAPIATNWFWIFSDGQVATVKNPIINFASSGTYTVTLTANNVNGTTQITKTVNVVLAGSSNTSAGPDLTACFGDVIPLNATTDDPNATVSWSPGVGLSSTNILNPLLGAISTRTYYLTVTSANGCQVTDTLVVNVSPLPTTLAIPVAGATINPGDSVRLNAFGADLFVWSPATGLSNPNIANPWAKPAATTLYTVTGYNSAGCTKSDEVLITVSGTTAIKPGEFGSVGAIYPASPNPSEAAITFSADFIREGSLQLRLYDLAGKPVAMIYEGRVAAGAFAHEWSRSKPLAGGLYFVVWEMQGKRFVEKIRLQ